MNFSFIIIGKNIEKTIDVCIQSVLNFVSKNSICDYEIIYVDSDSKDKSLKIALNYSIKIFRITGNVNAAIGRNIGAKYASGEVLFFIDGDMELLPDFFNQLFDVEFKRLKYSYSTGHLLQKIYDKDYNYLHNDDELLPDSPFFKYSTGGFSILNNNLRKKVGDMDERLVRNQDLDFSLRLSKVGFPVLKYNCYVAIHHTISYYDNSRITTFIFNKNLLYTGLLMRKHLLNPFYLKMYYKNCLYVFLLILISFSAFINLYLTVILTLIYVSLQLIRVGKNIKKERNLLNSFLYKFFVSFYSLIGFLLFFPRKPKYKVIQITN